MTRRRDALRSCACALLFGIALPRALPPLAAEEPAETITRESAERLGIEALPLRFRTTLVNTTQMLARSHGGRTESELIPVPDAEVYLIVIAGDGTRKSLPARSDPDGLLEADAGLRFRGTEVSVLAAVAQGVVLTCQPFAVGDEVPPLLRMFEITQDPSALLQRVSRIVTELPRASDEPDSRPAPKVKVRQVVTVLNQSFHVFQVITAGGGYIFSMPEGAELNELQVSGRDWPAREVVTTPDGIHGVPIQSPIFPAQLGSGASLEMMGTFYLPLEMRARADLGLAAQVTTLEFGLGLESGRFHYLPDEGAPARPAADGGLLALPNVSQRVHLHQWERIPASQRITAIVYRAERPPIHPRTLLVTFILIGGMALSVVLAYVLAEARRRERGQDGEAEPEAAAGAPAPADAELEAGSRR